MILNVKLLKDGTGRVCIHWLQESQEGPLEISGNAQLKKAMGQPLVFRGRIACNPKQNTVNPQHKGQEVLMCMHSNEIRAVTCPACLAVPEAIELLKSYEDIVEIAGVS